jgi:hypothetical protein
MIFTVQTPAYFPPLAGCAKMAAADVIVRAESFRFSRKEWAHRAGILTAVGVRWLSIPVLSKGRAAARIEELAIDAHQPWQEQHWRALEYNYHNAPYFYYYADGVRALIHAAGTSLVQLLASAVDFTGNCLNLKGKWISSSGLPDIADRTDRVLAWAALCGCDHYLIWPFEEALLDVPRLGSAGIRLRILEFEEAPYHQQFSGFVPGLSLLDLLFNEGPQAGSYIARNSRSRIWSERLASGSAEEPVRK